MIPRPTCGHPGFRLSIWALFQQYLVLHVDLPLSLFFLMADVFVVSLAIGHLFNHLSNLGIQSVLGSTESIIADVGFVQFCVNSITTYAIVIPPDCSSNSKLITSCTTDCVAEGLEVIWLESGPSWRHWGRHWV